MATSFSTDADATRPGTSGLAYNLAGLTLLILLLAVGVAYLIDQAGRTGGHAEPRLGDGNRVVQTVGARELSIPTNWFRYGEQIKEGFASQVDLRFSLDLPNLAPTRIEVSLLPRSRARASSTLLDRVYLHQFDDGLRDGYPGLVGKPLLPEEGYAGETVWYDPLSANPFVAKCAQAVETDRPDVCLRTIHLQSGIAAVLKFEATALREWRVFDAELAKWLREMGAL